MEEKEWVLISPNGEKFTGESPAKCAFKEYRSRESVADEIDKITAFLNICDLCEKNKWEFVLGKGTPAERNVCWECKKAILGIPDDCKCGSRRDSRIYFPMSHIECPDCRGVRVCSFRGAKSAQDTYPEWDKFATYSTGQYCVVNGKKYKSNTNKNINYNPEDGLFIPGDDGHILIWEEA